MNIARALLTETTMSRPHAAILSNEFAAVGVIVSVSEIIEAAASVSSFCPVREVYEISNRVSLSWSYDNLQDTLSAAGYRGYALYSAWARVKGHLLLRFSRGNYSAPRASTVLRWAEQEARLAA